MKRTKRGKAPMKIHTTPPTVESTADLPEPKGEPGAVDLMGAQGELGKATKAVAEEKLAEARAPKPRRVGPLRKIHMATLERAQELARPLVEQLLDLRREVNAINARAIDDVLEDLGSSPREKGEDARLVEEGGETYVVLSPASARQSQRQAPPAQGPQATKATQV